MPANVFVHPTAIVDEPCEIGAGTKIWHFSHVMAGSRIGRGCNIGQNVVVSPDVVIGDNVKIQNNVSVYAGVELEDDVFCGPSCVFTNVINPRAFVETMEILAAAAKSEPSKFEMLFASHPVTSERIATARERNSIGIDAAGMSFWVAN